MDSSSIRPEPFGPFLLLRRIAVGGSAEVYLARPKTGQKPAPQLVVKRLLQPSQGGNDFGVLQREAALHQAVTHPNVVTVFGAGMVDNEPYIAMEYVEGVDAYRLLRRSESEERRIPAGLAVYVARRVALALDSVHSATDGQGQPLNIVHRDITPSNIYLSIRGEVKVGDFGIARASTTRRSLGKPGALQGKFGYLAPEQVAGEPFDHRADLFSLTVLLGEMLIGERIFPGSGQLAVLLAIRDGNIERLRSRASELPPGLYDVCERGLARSPEDRFSSAREMARALEPFVRPSEAELERTLSEWVRWAWDSGDFAQKIEGRIRDSVQRLRAVRLAATLPPDLTPLPRMQPTESEGPKDTRSRIKRSGSDRAEQVAFPRLLEMIATGELGRGDQVALMGGEFQPIESIDELARHLLPSTTQTTVQLHQPGVPDYQVLLDEVRMSEVLAHLRRRRESGALFVSRREGGAQQRKEIYLRDGRLHHVASSERAELLGEYLIRRGALRRDHLEAALRSIEKQGGRLGDTLISMGTVEAIDIFRAIRDQGRDRVAAICAWSRGTVTFYRGTEPGKVEFPLDLDLASPMMAGIMLLAQGDARTLLPDLATPVLRGARFGECGEPKERGTAPASLQVIPDLVQDGITIAQLLELITARPARRGGRSIGTSEAGAAILAACDLGWLTFSPPGQ